MTDCRIRFRYLSQVTQFVPTGDPEWLALDQTASTVSVSLSDPAVVRLSLHSAPGRERPAS